MPWLLGEARTGLDHRPASHGSTARPQLPVHAQIHYQSLTPCPLTNALPEPKCLSTHRSTARLTPCLCQEVALQGVMAAAQDTRISYPELEDKSQQRGGTPVTGTHHGQGLTTGKGTGSCPISAEQWGCSDLLLHTPAPAGTSTWGFLGVRGKARL